MMVRLVSPLVLFVMLSPVSIAAAQNGSPAEVAPAVQTDVSQPIRSVAVQPGVVLQPRLSSPATTSLSFDGLGNGFVGPQGQFVSNYAAPDSNGAVGDTQYVQWVNNSFAVFNKATGAVVYGPAAGNSLWNGFGGECENTNNGDPIVQYDKAAARWVMTQLASGPTGFYQCVAVSTTSDATGSYYRYAFQQPYFNDYPKLGVWPDAYYVTFNLYNGNTFLGARACALDRTSMLNGAPATQQCFQFLNSVDSLLPSDMDGTIPPPAGSPNYVTTLLGTSYLRMWKFHVDWVNPAATSMTGPYVMAITPFSKPCGTGGACVPQPGTSQLLNSVGDRLMYRLAYRNFGDHESLIASHSVATSNAIGVKWYEVRSLSGTPTLYQEGTYAPDSNYRWMGSIAMDQSGNIALGYSLSNTTTKPSIAFTGRAAADPPGTMGAETILVYGSGSQTSGIGWGEYSNMSIDPKDDCTFWYTNEYLTSDGSLNWNTRIASFRFPSCGTVLPPDFVMSATPPSNTVIQGSSTSYTVSISGVNGFTANTDLSVSGLPANASYSFNPASVASSGTSTFSVTTTLSTPPGTYPLTITGTSGSIVHSTTVMLVVSSAVPDFTLSAAPGSSSVTQGAATTFSVTVSPLYGFTANVDLSISGLPPGSTYSFNPPSIAGSGTSTLTIRTSGSTTPSLYGSTITGTSGSLVHSTTVILTVTAPPDFTLATTPSSNTVIQGSATNFTVSVSALRGFAANVDLTLAGIPAGAAYSFNPPSVAGSGTSTLNLTISTSTPAGTYNLTVTGTSGSLVHSTTVTVVVNPPPDFSLAATPSSNTVIQGSATSYTVSVSAINNFAGTVGLTLSGLPAGATYTFNPVSIATGGNSSLSVTTSTATSPGTYTLTITGTSGSLVHSSTVALVVNSVPDFTVTATPSNRALKRGNLTNYTITITPSNGFNDLVSFSVSGLPNSTAFTFSPSSIVGTGSTTFWLDTARSTRAGGYPLTITATTGSGLSHSVTVTLVVY